MYKATHKELGFCVAIKKLSLDHHDIAGGLMKEINFLKKFRHDSIVSYFGSCEDKKGMTRIMVIIFCLYSGFTFCRNPKLGIFFLFVSLPF